MIQALSTRLVIKQIKTDDDLKTTSGIILSQSSNDTPKATVVAVGPDLKQKISIGDVVVPIWNRSHGVRIDGQDLFGIDEQDIIVVVKK